MGTFKNMQNFVLFFNIFVFIYSVLNSNTLGTIRVLIKYGSINIDYNLNLLTIVVSIVVILIIASLSGINILSSGVNDTGTQQIIGLVCFLTTYLIMSTFTLTFLNPLGLFGGVIWGIMSILYAMGYMESRMEV